MLCYHAGMTHLAPFAVPAAEAGATLAAVLRARLPGQSWKQVRALVASRRVTVLGELCLDPARRLKEGELVELRARPLPKPVQPEQIVVRHLDEHVVVVEKPAGVSTVRHPSERAGRRRRRELSPTLEDLLPRRIARAEGVRTAQPRLRVVQRLDKETSGLIVFARTVTAERGLGKQFHAHTVTRRYLALVRRRHPGAARPQLPGPRPRRRPARQHQGGRAGQGGRHARRGRRAPGTATRSSAAGWRRAARTRSASTSPSWGIPCAASASIASSATAP